MAYSVTIDGVDRTGDVINQSITVEDVLNDQQNTCSFKLIDRSGNGIPSPDDEITITLADDTKLFGGYIESVDLKQREYGEVVASISCVDYARLLDRNLVHGTYEDMTDKEIIESIISDYCPGFGITTTNVVEGVTISQMTFNYIQPSQCFRKIAELTGRNWYIDYDKDIHYFALTQNPAPFNITDTPLDILTELMDSTPTGTLKSNAAYISGSPSYVRLTSTSNNVHGELEYTETLPSAFIAELIIRAQGGSGADAIYFYWGASSTPTSEDSAIGGYCVAFDEWTDNLQLKFNGTSLIVIPYSNIDNGARRFMKIVVDGTNIKVYIDGVLQIDYDDTTRVLAGSLLGVGARTGGSTNNHELYYLVIKGVYTDFQELSIRKDASQLRNRVYVRGGTYLSDTTTYSEKGDGTKKKFVLPDKPHNVTVTVNGTPKTLGIKNVNLSGYDWYLNFQEKYIEQDSGGAVLTSTDELVVTYKYDIPILIAVEDTDSIMEHGQKEFAIFDKAITTIQAARDRATAELTDFASNIVEGSFRTYETGFIAGQYINIDRDDYDIDADYLVQKVTATSEGGGAFIYEISLASSKTMGIIKFLIELLEANKNLIELDPNEVVDNLFELADSLNADSLVDNLSIDSCGPYFTWCSDSLDSGPSTRAIWDLFTWAPF